MIYAIFDGEFVEVKSMYKKSNGGPTYYSIWVVGSDGEYYAKNYDSEELRDKVWNKIIGKLVHNARPSCDTFIDFTTDSKFVTTYKEGKI